jgi:hypothetical protein
MRYLFSAIFSLDSFCEPVRHGMHAGHRAKPKGEGSREQKQIEL